MKVLNGRELAEFIKERQAKAVRGLRQAHGIKPKLAIVLCNDDPVIRTYIKLKKRYGADIEVEVEDYFVEQADIPALLKKLNDDDSVHGIIVQLPLTDIGQTDEIVDQVAPHKDVDALGKNAKFDPATPLAIMWLLSGYNVELNGQHILLIGRGKLVGAPLEKILKSSGLDVEVIGREAKDLSEHTKAADVIITATGSPAILYSKDIKYGAVVVDAGVASESGKTVGDLADDVYARDDLIITPKKGGVGPLTVCALFENTILAARRTIEAN
ncbi:MAG: tetrahydrofolate dehydrogenase/cyclohydrolase catalytic domain-containing protein [Candidatus Saccharimonadales bacterium]